MSETRKEIQKSIGIDITCGLFTGAFCSGLFNPWDRALYLSVFHSRSFLSLKNFSAPYQGVFQAVTQRSVFGGIYYVMQGQLKTYAYPYLRNTIGLNESATQLSIGLVAGSFNGILINPLSAVKYHTWGNDDRVFFSSVRHMYANGGFKPFLNGMWPTVTRDAIFGCTYEVVRHFLCAELSKHNNKVSDTKLAAVSNILAAGLSTIWAAPFNYVRNMQYKTVPGEKQASTKQVLSSLWQQSKEYDHGSFRRLGFFQQRLRIGWGTARVAVGMAVGQQIFDYSRNTLQASLETKHKR